MTKRITLQTFRKVSAMEEAMIRASMPRTSAADPEPLPAHAAPTKAEIVSARLNGTRLVRPLTYTLGEREEGL